MAVGWEREMESDVRLVEGTHKKVDCFSYLGKKVVGDGWIQHDVSNRLKKEEEVLSVSEASVVGWRLITGSEINSVSIFLHIAGVIDFELEWMGLVAGERDEVLKVKYEGR